MQRGSEACIGMYVGSMYMCVCARFGEEGKGASSAALAYDVLCVFGGSACSISWVARHSWVFCMNGVVEVVTRELRKGVR